MTASHFKLLNTVIEPGRSMRLHLSAPESYSNATMEIPVHVINGKKAGPVLLVCAAVHGDEINGVEIIRRLLRLPTLKNLTGTLIAVPVVNVYGFMYQSRYLPDRRDLNRSFPGNKTGSLTGRLAYLFMKEIVKKCTHGIDLHSGAIHRNNLPQIRINFETPNAERLAKAFNVPIILNSNLRDGSLREMATKLNIPILLYEAGEALRFDEMSIRLGVQGILNVMAELGMLEQNKLPHRRRKIISRVARYSVWVRANYSGIMSPRRQIGKAVRKNEVLGIIADPFSWQESEILAPMAGIIIGCNNLPLVHEGEALFHIASFDEVDKIAHQVSKLSEDEALFSVF